MKVSDVGQRATGFNRVSGLGSQRAMRQSQATRPRGPGAFSACFLGVVRSCGKKRGSLEKWLKSIKRWTRAVWADPIARLGLDVHHLLGFRPYFATVASPVSDSPEYRYQCSPKGRPSPVSHSQAEHHLIDMVRTSVHNCCLYTAPNNNTSHSCTWLECCFIEHVIANLSDLIFELNLVISSMELNRAG